MHPPAQNYYLEDVLSEYKVSFNASAVGGFRNLPKLARLEISSSVRWQNFLRPTLQGAAFLSWNLTSFMNTGTVGPLPVSLPPRLSSLMLDFNYLTGRIPNQWCEAKSLIFFNLHFMPNLLGPIPACFGRKMILMQQVSLIGNPGLNGPIPWESLSARFRSNQSSEYKTFATFSDTYDAVNDARMTHLILANNNLSGPVLPPRGGAGDLAFAEEWNVTRTVAQNVKETNSTATNTTVVTNRCSIQTITLSGNPHLSGEIHPGIAHCKDLVSLYLHGTGISGSVPGEICGNCYFVVLTLHNISAFEGDNDTQVAKRRAFRRSCSRAKSDSYSKCLRGFKSFDVSGSNRNGPFRMTRITDADGTWDCGGNLSTEDSHLNPVGPFKRDGEYDGCTFRPTTLRTDFPLAYGNCSLGSVDSLKSKSDVCIDTPELGVQMHEGTTNKTYYYPVTPT
jgi:hypothetical protein